MPPIRSPPSASELAEQQQMQRALPVQQQPYVNPMQQMHGFTPYYTNHFALPTMNFTGMHPSQFVGLPFPQLQFRGLPLPQIRLPTTQTLAPPNANPRFKTTLCKTFLSNGTCPYGPKCRFAHGHHDLRKMSGVQSSGGFRGVQRAALAPGVGMLHTVDKMMTKITKEGLWMKFQEKFSAACPIYAINELPHRHNYEITFMYDKMEEIHKCLQEMNIKYIQMHPTVQIFMKRVDKRYTSGKLLRRIRKMFPGVMSVRMFPPKKSHEKHAGIGAMYWDRKVWESPENMEVRMMIEQPPGATDKKFWEVEIDDTLEVEMAYTNGDIHQTNISYKEAEVLESWVPEVKLERLPGPDMHKLFVDHVPKNLTERDLAHYFSEFTEVQGCRLRLCLRRYNKAIIACKNVDDALDIMEEKHVFSEKTLDVRPFDIKTDLKYETTLPNDAGKMFFIGGIPRKADDLVKNYFGEFGEIEEFNIGRGYVFMSYVDPDLHHEVIGREHTMFDVELDVRYQLSKREVERQNMEDEEGNARRIRRMREVAEEREWEAEQVAMENASDESGTEAIVLGESDGEESTGETMSRSRSKGSMSRSGTKERAQPKPQSKNAQSMSRSPSRRSVSRSWSGSRSPSRSRSRSRSRSYNDA